MLYLFLSVLWQTPSEASELPFDSLRAKALECRADGELVRSLQLQYLALDLARGDQASFVLKDIGTLLCMNGNFARGIEYFNNAIESSSDSHLVGICHNNLGLAYMNLEMYEKSATHYRSAIVVNKSLEIANRLGQNYINLADVFRQTEQYDSAKFYLQNSLSISSNINDSIAAINTLSAISIDQGHYQEAAELANVGLELATDSTNKQVIASLNYNLYQANKQLGAFEEALTAYQTAVQIDTHLASVDVRLRLLQSIQRHEEEIHREQIERISAQNALKDSEIARGKEKEFFLSISVFLLLCWLLTGFFHIRSLKKRSEPKPEDPPSFDHSIEMRLLSLRDAYSLDEEDVILCRYLIVDKRVKLIATKMNKSPQTVYGYLDQLEAKMGVSGLDELRQILTNKKKA